MKVLLIDGTNLGDGIAQVLTRGGHDVYATTTNWGTCRWAKSLPFDPRFTDALSQTWDLVIGPGSFASISGAVDEFRCRNIPTIGAGRRGFLLEHKDMGRKVFEEAHLPSPRWLTFAGKSDAIAFVEHGPFDRVVVKYTDPSRPFRTVVCNSATDAVRVLQSGETGEIVLEEVVDGIEVGFMAYFDGTRFIDGTTKIEYKRLWPGDMGVLTPEMGSVVWYDPTDRWHDFLNAILSSPTAREYLRSYRGFIDFACIMRKDGSLVPLEFTCRGGIPETEIMLQLVNEARYGEFLLSVAEGCADDSLLKHAPGFGVGVNLVVAGYPWNDGNQSIGTFGSPVRGIQDVECQTTCHGMNIAFGDSVPVTTEGMVMNVAAMHLHLSEAIEIAYRNVRRISFQDMVWRPDIGASLKMNWGDLFHAGIVSEIWGWV